MHENQETTGQSITRYFKDPKGTSVFTAKTEKQARSLSRKRRLIEISAEEGVAALKTHRNIVERLRNHFNRNHNKDNQPSKTSDPSEPSE